jgi:hypothetical protein
VWNSESAAVKKTPLIEEGAASRELAAFSLNSLTQYGRTGVPSILRCFATHQTLLRDMTDISETLILVHGRPPDKRSFRANGEQTPFFPRTCIGHYPLGHRVVGCGASLHYDCKSFIND